MYTMKMACEKTGLTYETLKFYCNQGLVPNVKRDSNNHRIFDDRDIAWINSLNCLRSCSMSIQEMRDFIRLCLEGPNSIPERKAILEEKKSIWNPKCRSFKTASTTSTGNKDSTMIFCQENNLIAAI